MITKEHKDGNPWPIIGYAVESDPEGHVCTLRERASVRPGYYAFDFGYPVDVIEGQPTEYIDYRY